MPLEKASFEKYHKGEFDALKEADAQVYELITQEYERLQNSLDLIAAENQCSRAVLAALGSVVQNKTAEGFPGARLHGGCEVVDDVEKLAVARAKEAFSAQYANVQPHSGTQTNQIVLTALLERGDTILSLGLDHGGHFSHGAKLSFTGKFFDVENYYLDKRTFLLDYDAVRDKAVEIKPKLIICGASAYTRTIDFKKFREIADEVGAYLLADISHITGLVIAGAHPSPVDYAHFTTTSTYKPGGPRGGLIVMGGDCDQKIKVSGKDKQLWEHIEDTTFPGVQGTPYLNHIAAKAVFFKETLTEEYRARQFKIIENAKRLASECLTGVIAQKCLEDCSIIVDMIKLPYDKREATITGGIRLGTPVVTKRGMGVEEMGSISALIDAVLKRVKIVSDNEYRIDNSFKEQMKNKVKGLCSRFPIC
jgi:glycine hydroxymethyltransferase